ncbi:MAG: hypothetical protein JXR96_25715, partial [Deltaproteobacteria bacterium]|nr:hypothetical protein [Deltaproteobacteria bacterium]
MQKHRTLESGIPILVLAVGLAVTACQAPGGDDDRPARRLDALQATGLIEKAAPRLEMLDAGPDSIALDFEAGRFELGAERRAGELWNSLGCPGCGVSGELGKPRLPVIRRFLEVPAGAELAVEIEDATRRRLSLAELGARHRLLPVQRPIPKLPGARERAPFDIDEAVYAEDAFYPDTELSLSAPLVVRGHDLRQLELHPIRYNPVRGELELLESARLRVVFAAPKAAGPALAVRPSPAFDRWLRDRVLNYQTPPKTRGVSTAKYAEGILAIAGNAYADDAQLLSYLEDRRAEGHRVELVAIADIGTSTSQVRSYIQGEYATWSEPSLSYVLIVGDTANVPVYTGDAGSGWDDHVTDLYYASISPNNYDSDLLAPDLMVSRISVNNLAELATYLTRAEHYLWADWATDTDWLRKFSFLASCDNSEISEGTHDYVIDKFTAPLGFTGTYPSNPQLGGDQLYCASGNTSESNIRTHLGDGRLVINFSGHGDETEWGDPAFTSSYLAGVTPPDASPYVISNACLTGTFGRSGGDCWGEMWLAKEEGGAILFWGGSSYTYWPEDDILERRLWDGVFEDGLTRLADGTQNAKMQTLDHYGATDNMRYYFEIYNMLGDGTLDLYTDTPFDAYVDHATEIPVGVDALDVVVTRDGTALEGALACVRGDGVQQVGYTDAAGHVQLLMNPAPADVGSLQLTVTAHNMRRYRGAVQVVPADGPYLVHAGHELTSDGTAPVAPNPGRHVVLPIELRNIGNQTAANIQASLSSGSPLVSFTQAQPVFPEIAIDAVGRSSVHAELDIASSAPDGAMLDFLVEWTTDGGYAGSTRFSIAVARPLLVYAGHTVDDSLADCDRDGIPDVDEDTAFRVAIENRGSGDASSVSVSLYANGCDLSGPAMLGDLPAGQQGEAIFVVTPRDGVGCPALSVPFTVDVSAAELPDADRSGFEQLLNADLVLLIFEDDMEGTAPNGWTHGASSGNDDWRYVTSSSHSPSHAWWASDPSSTSNKYLRTPSIDIGDTAQLSFWQRFDFEEGWDGGQLEISVDGGAWTNLAAAISQGGYNDVISDWADSPFAGQAAWSGVASWHQVTADLSAFGPAAVRLQFHFASDSSEGGGGWWIDDFSLDAETLICQQQTCLTGNRPPQADAGPDQTVAAGDSVQLDGRASRDPNGDELDLTWSQTEGPAVTLSDVHAGQPTFTAPDVRGELLLVFELSAFDGEFTDTDSVTVTVWGCDDDEDCTQDVFTGDGCSHTPLADCSLCGTDGVCMGAVCRAGAQGQGLACDDGDACTQTDTCQAGLCTGGEPVVCQPLDACHLAGTCDPATGECSNPLAPGGTACDDGDACTRADYCQAGMCIGADPVSCRPLDGCHLAGVCDPASGECSDPAAPDGTVCDDGDACTRSDACQAGVCTGADPVICQSADDCHASECNPASGECVSSTLPDGTACDDGDACTRDDACLAGSCAGEAVICEPLDGCHSAGTCDPASGACTNPAAPDGTACDDGDACTLEDACRAGVCTPGEPLSCEPLDDCHLAGSCNPETGECANPEAPDGTPCEGGECQDGVCTEVSGGGCGCGQGSGAPASALLLL